MKNGSDVDSRCRDITSQWAREDSSAPKCDWFEKFESSGKSNYLTGVYSLEDLRNFGAREDWFVFFKKQSNNKKDNLCRSGVHIFWQDKWLVQQML